MLDHIALGVLLLQQIVFWFKLNNIRNDLKTVKSWSHQGWECWHDLGNILLKYKLLPPKNSADQGWNWGDGR